MISAFLKDAANSDTHNMAVNGSVTPANYDYIAAQHILVTDINIAVWDNAAGDEDGFFTLAALSTGLTFEVMDATPAQIFDFTDGVNMTVHALFGAIGGTLVETTQAGGGGYDAEVDINPDHLWDGPLYLGPGERIRMTVRDDLSAITGMVAMIHADLDD
jgi:hypothetical protein